MRYFAFKHSKELLCIAASGEGDTLGEFLNKCKTHGIHFSFILASDLLETDEELKAVDIFLDLERKCKNGEVKQKAFRA